MRTSVDEAHRAVCTSLPTIATIFITEQGHLANLRQGYGKSRDSVHLAGVTPRQAEQSPIPGSFRQVQLSYRPTRLPDLTILGVQPSQSRIAVYFNSPGGPSIFFLLHCGLMDSSERRDDQRAYGER